MAPAAISEQDRAEFLNVYGLRGNAWGVCCPVAKYEITLAVGGTCVQGSVSENSGVGLWFAICGDNNHAVEMHTPLTKIANVRFHLGRETYAMRRVTKAFLEINERPKYRAHSFYTFGGPLNFTSYTLNLPFCGFLFITPH